MRRRVVRPRRPAAPRRRPGATTASISLYAGRPRPGDADHGVRRDRRPSRCPGPGRSHAGIVSMDAIAAGDGLIASRIRRLPRRGAGTGRFAMRRTAGPSRRACDRRFHSSEARAGPPDPRNLPAIMRSDPGRPTTRVIRECPVSVCPSRSAGMSPSPPVPLRVPSDVPVPGPRRGSVRLYVRVHGPIINSVNMRIKCENRRAGPATSGPEATTGDASASSDRRPRRGCRHESGW